MKINELVPFFKKNSRLLLFLVPALIIFFSIVYFFRSLFVVALVNGQPISRLTLVRKLEKKAGKQALDGLITEALILQEGQKQKISVTDEEINQQIKKLEEDIAKQGQNLDQVLTLQGMSKEELKKQIKMQILVDKMAGKDIQVTEAEIKTYFEENKEAFGKDAKLESVKEEIKQQLEQQKLSAKVQAWIETLHNNAKINYFLEF